MGVKIGASHPSRVVRISSRALYWNHGYREGHGIQRGHIAARSVGAGAVVPPRLCPLHHVQLHLPPRRAPPHRCDGSQARRGRPVSRRLLRRAPRELLGLRGSRLPAPARCLPHGGRVVRLACARYRNHPLGAGAAHPRPRLRRHRDGASACAGSGTVGSGRCPGARGVGLLLRNAPPAHDLPLRAAVLRRGPVGRHPPCEPSPARPRHRRLGYLRGHALPGLAQLEGPPRTHTAARQGHLAQLRPHAVAARAAHGAVRPAEQLHAPRIWPAVRGGDLGPVHFLARHLRRGYPPTVAGGHLLEGRQHRCRLSHRPALGHGRLSAAGVSVEPRRGHGQLARCHGVAHRRRYLLVHDRRCRPRDAGAGVSAVRSRRGRHLPHVACRRGPRASVRVAHRDGDRRVAGAGPRSGLPVLHHRALRAEGPHPGIGEERRAGQGRRRAGRPRAGAYLRAGPHRGGPRPTLMRRAGRARPAHAPRDRCAWLPRPRPQHPVHGRAPVHLGEHGEIPRAQRLPEARRALEAGHHRHHQRRRVAPRPSAAPSKASGSPDERRLPAREPFLTRSRGRAWCRREP